MTTINGPFSPPLISIHEFLLPVGKYIYETNQPSYQSYILIKKKSFESSLKLFLVEFCKIFCIYIQYRHPISVSSAVSDFCPVLGLLCIFSTSLFFYFYLRTGPEVADDLCFHMCRNSPNSSFSAFLSSFPVRSPPSPHLTKILASKPIS